MNLLPAGRTKLGFCLEGKTSLWINRLVLRWRCRTVSGPRGLAQQKRLLALRAGGVFRALGNPLALNTLGEPAVRANNVDLIHFPSRRLKLQIQFYKL